MAHTSYFMMIWVLFSNKGGLRMRLVFVRWKILKLTRRVFPSERKRGMLMLAMVKFESMGVLLVESSRANEDRVSRWETKTVRW